MTNFTDLKRAYIDANPPAPKLGTYGRSAIGGHAWQEPDEPHGPGGPVCSPTSLASDPFARRRDTVPEPAQTPSEQASTETVEGSELRRLFGAAWSAKHRYSKALADAKTAHARAIDRARSRLAELSARPVPPSPEVAWAASDQIEAAKLELAALERSKPDDCLKLKESAKVATSIYEQARRLARGV